MADLVVNPELAEKIARIARRHNRPVEAILAEMVERYETLDDTPPGSTLRDEAIDVPADVLDTEGYRAQIRAMRLILYKKAREYWQQTGDQARLALTNTQLDEQFWCIDPEGIPRLKSDQDQVQLPPDPLESFINLVADSDLTDASTSTRETQAAHYRKRYGRSD